MTGRVLLTAVLLVGVAAPPAGAAPTYPTPRCVTIAEYVQVRQGMTPARVGRILGPRGRVVWRLKGSRAHVRTYKPCGRYDTRSFVVITYGKSGRLLKAEARLVPKTVDA